MPHIIIEYTPEGDRPNVDEMLVAAHAAAKESGLFAEQDIKVRAKSYDRALIAGKPAKFVHILVYLVKGRTPEQKRELTEMVHAALLPFFTGYASISVDARDLDKDFYIKSAG